MHKMTAEKNVLQQELVNISMKTQQHTKVKQGYQEKKNVKPASLTVTKRIKLYFTPLGRISSIYAFNVMTPLRKRKPCYQKHLN